MCLERLREMTEKDRKRRKFFKVMCRVYERYTKYGGEGQILGYEFPYYRGTGPIGLGERVEAHMVRVRCGETIDYYLSGFHAFATMKGASYWGIRDIHCVIVEVEGEVACVGTDLGHKAYVLKNMIIKREVPINV